MNLKRAMEIYVKATKKLQNYGRNSAKNTPPTRDVSGKVTKDYYGSTKWLNPLKKSSYKD